MTFNFDHTKNLALTKKDKSNKNSFDKKIVNLCNIINKSPNFFTTSSCSGRITLLINNSKKLPNLFFYRTHKTINFSDFKKHLMLACKTDQLIYFKQEPAILVVACKNKDHQTNLFSLARNNGWKNSGILSLDKKFLIELKSTEKIIFPIVFLGKILVDDEFLKLVIKITNQNLEKTWEKIKRLENLLIE